MRLPLLLSLVLAGCAPRAPRSVDDAARPAANAGPAATAEHATIEGSGVKLAMRSYGAPGARRTLIVLHGGPGLSHHYTRPLERLAAPGAEGGVGTDELRIVTYDQRAVGGSSPTLVHAIDFHVEDLEAIRAATGDERVHLLGHSWGGLVAMAYAATHPEHVASMILVDSVPPWREAWERAGERFEERRAALVEEGLVPSTLPPITGPDCSARLTALLPVYYADPRHPATHDLGGSSCHSGILELTFIALGRFDYRAPVAKISAPTLVLAGARDPFGAEMAHDVARALPSATTGAVILPSCGHIPWEECGAEFDARVRAFLATKS